ncbi:copper homeostasis periplasmic binding protein CopC [Pseudomonas sp. CDFA 602]|uniref:copper homeostasis periplasmic binding protein CopC n=1 Tax=Pseudomonas californiensis TaxID=2829823 RepID=UPI001E40C685|nr:copper homeostasis periplasmic binding protein CopC [Pseudomonas californiensis]MCD5995706.1 copper homeostasis periplasmic binding protein CopC [Pseudomonas californiensis]MCD6001300.1 copper homeostasis periplasmic binding protein CopC [Pseudomonas californiensis]
MSLIRSAAVVFALSSSLLLSPFAQAHSKLLSSTPADQSQGPAPAKIELRFSENLVAQFSGAKLVMTEMPGMQHPPMTMKTAVSASTDPKTMVITPATPLVEGTYVVEWRVVSADTHVVTGNVTFTVK